MKCQNCGTEFNEGIFCPECGTKYVEPVKISDAEIEKAKADAEKARAKADEEMARAKVEADRLAKEKAEHEAEIARQKTEQNRIATEQRAKEKEIDAKTERERLAKEKAEHEAEIARQKTEQERLAVERAAHEVELARQQNEMARIEQENKAKAEELEKKKQEELTRTFNGVLYDSVEEMNLAKEKYDVEKAEEDRLKSVNRKALISMILGIASWPLAITVILWFPAAIISMIFGIKALKEGTTKRGFAITGIVTVGIYVGLMLIGGIGLIIAAVTGQI